MRKVRIDGVYRLSALLGPLKQTVSSEDAAVSTYLRILQARQLFDPFLETWSDYLGSAGDSARAIGTGLEHWDKTLEPLAMTAPGITQALGHHAYGLHTLATDIRTFETVLEQEASRMNTFVVEQVGGYSMQHLIERASEGISEDLRACIPEGALKDYDAAGRCLAFDLFTASGFHIVRSLEAVVVAYHDLFTCGPLPQKDRNWGEIVKRLKAESPPAPERLTSLLDHLRNEDRNPIIHPERVLNQSEAVTAFNLVGGVMMEFAQALKTLKAQKGI